MNDVIARLSREKKEIDIDPIDEVLLIWTSNNRVILAQIEGPEGSFYEGGSFKLQIKVTEKYPSDPPQVTMLTKIIHPNIDSDGFVSIPCLKNWRSSTAGIKKIISEVKDILSHPSTSEPLNLFAAKLFNDDQNQFAISVKDQINYNKMNEQ